MTASWKDVRCASIPVAALAELADLRGQPGIRVSIDRDRAWICWESDCDQMREMLVRRILPAPGTVMFTRRDGRWYRLGEHLPAFDVPLVDGASGVPLHRLVLPSPVKARRPAANRSEPRALRLVRDESGLQQPTSAVRCPAHVLSSWADHATSNELALLQAICAFGPAGPTHHSPVLVVGPTAALPLVPESIRYWGTALLVPLGCRIDPELPESTVRRAAGADSGHLVVFEDDGFELIPRALFRTLSRAALRLACGMSGVTPTGTAADPGARDGGRR
jgi:hypothetical protein